MQIGAASMENGMEIPQRIRNRDALCPSHLTTGNLTNKPEINNPKRLMHPYVHCSIIHHSQEVEATRVPPLMTGSKMWFIYAMEYCSAIKKDKIVPFAITWMGLQSIMLSEVSQK